MQKIIILKGLPASGKSTWAKNYIKQHSKEKWKIINKDSLRLMLDDSKWSRENEKFIIRVRDNIIQSALGMGYNVIVDDTNFSKSHEDRVRLVAEGKATVEIYHLNTSVEECVERDLKRANSVGADVIYRMYNKYLFKPEPVDMDFSLRPAVIVDIDGTLAKMNGRSPFDWRKVGSDLVHEHMAFVVRSLRESGVNIILLSGRDGSCREETVKWLAENKIDYSELYMREADNCEKDTVIKERIYREKIDGRFVVMAVFDDRACVRRMWLSLGLPVFGCDQAYYPIEF